MDVAVDTKINPTGLSQSSYFLFRKNVIELQKHVDGSLKDLFMKQKDFKAHITLARIKFPERQKNNLLMKLKT